MSALRLISSFTVLGFLTILSGVAGAQDADAKDPAALLAEGDALMVDLGDGDPQGAIAKYEEAAKAGASDFDVNWRIARAYFWWSDWQNDEDTKVRLGKKGMAYGEKAIAAEPSRVEGHYFYALGVGEYSKGISIIKAITQGMEKKFKKHAEKAIEIDASFDGGGPMNALGRFYYELPWPKRDLKESRKILEKNLESFPNSHRTRYYLAETLIAMKKEDQAKKHLAYIREHDPMDINVADGKRYQRMAAALEKKLQ